MRAKIAGAAVAGIFGVWMFGDGAFAQESPSGMVIQKAQYGTPGKYCDASELVKSLCEGRQKCSIAVDASVCDAPAPKRNDNTLTVYFACGENGGAMKGKKDETIEIVCE